ncbi:MAG: hypothetical protein K8R31_12655 [Bacteroidales bacterium]|nr:hypothetical protein [Bacteroidales bacterium]
MKLKNLLFIAILTLGSSTLFAQISKLAPKVVVIGIGEKNSTLDESQYPNLKFYYTPELINIAEETFSGKPEFLVTLGNDKNLKETFMLFDKNGVCVTQGYRLLSQNNDIGAKLCVDKDNLQNHLKTYVKKEKEGKASSKEMKLKKSDYMIGYKMPEFNVVTPSGEEVSFNSIVEGQATLIVFFQLSSDIDIAEGKKSDQSDKSGKQLFAAMTQGAAGSKTTKLFVNLESQFFNYDTRD